MDLCWCGLLKTAPDIPLQTVLKSSSSQADEINRLTNYFFWAAGFILLVVAAFTAFVLYRFRARQREGLPELSLNKKWEIPMIGVPSLLVVIFLYLNIRTIRRVEPETSQQAPEVVITGHQWWWEAYYPASGVITANEIHLPAGRLLRLKLLASDVIHDWWVPQFGNKMDMVPTQENYLWLNIKSPGEYHGVCSEFCGDQHAHMRIRVVAQTEQEYNEWLHSMQQAPGSGTVARGGQYFQQKTCGSCHRIAGTTANGHTGPDLTHLGSRKTLLAGMLVNNEQNLESFIRDPQSIKPGVHMPNFLLDDTTVKAIAAYLYSLR